MFVDIVIAFHDCDSLKLYLHQVRVRIGSPIAGYGQESRNRAARQRIPNRTWTDEDGNEHVEINGSLARKAIREMMARGIHISTDSIWWWQSAVDSLVVAYLSTLLALHIQNHPACIPYYIA
ncbi:unnamed protein product [Fraxinus pennsylvanica]|uniref:Mitochondrial import inner membrane translocase subunit Tim21 n=1 Tax=Fraxinus pennsylvanica TaxID=56036 RepID=A0AAD2DUW0_9LAMI|nr:unnamed protein product [Fraxinus pennsylvanica]